MPRPTSHKKRLGLVVPTIGQGGGVQAVARFVKDAALRSARYDINLLSLCMSSRDACSLQLSDPSTWLRGATTRRGEWDGVPFMHVGAVLGEIEFQRYLPRAALTREIVSCDVVQVVCGSPAWANAVVGMGRPVALQVATRARVERRQRDRKPSDIKGHWRKAMTYVTDALDQRGLQRVDAIQVENPWMLDEARAANAGRDIDIRYAPPGVNATLFSPRATRDLSNAPYILFVGRMADPRKNLRLLSSAYAQLPGSLRKRVRIVLAGSSPPPEDFWLHAAALDVRDRIDFVAQPSRDELVRLYRDAAVFALPSDEEGLGVVLLEAMACGVPVVSTRCGGPDGIITDGVDGYLVARDDATALAARLQAVLEDDARNLEMGRTARSTIEARYDEHVAGAVFVEMWDRLTS